MAENQPEDVNTNVGTTENQDSAPKGNSFFDQMNAVKSMAYQKVEQTKDILKDKMNTIFKKDDEPQIQISVTEPTQRGSGISGYTVYQIKGIDNQGQFEVFRRYNEFDLLRDIMKQRWPGCYVPPLPEQKIGSNDKQIIEQRLRFLDYFVRQVGQLKHLFYSEEFQTMIRGKEPELTQVFEQYPKQSATQIYVKYQLVFPGFQGSTSSEKVVQIQSFSGFLQKTQNNIRAYKDPSINLVNSRDQMGAQLMQLNDMFLPEYEKNCLLEYTAGDETRLIMSNPTNESLAKIQEELKELAQRNAYRDLSDMLRIEVREIDGFLEAISARDQIETKKQQIKIEIRETEADVAKIAAGGKTMRSMMFKGTPDQFKLILEGEITLKNKEMESYEALGLFVTELLADQEINSFKAQKEEAYKSLLKNISQLELEYYQKQYQYWNELENLAKKLLKSELN